ncbi:MAG: hypothetical protein LW875_08770 [Proteobacteria bacterium]|jgi:hypothetical protein|nr:hypothetical protein [Pseudomonadota bacterium]
MKKIGDIMNDLGFREDAPRSLKEAFIKNLIKAAYGIEVETPSEAIQRKVKDLREPEQLEFDMNLPTKVG